MYALDVRNDITVGIFILQKESTDVRLPTFHHFLDGSNNGTVLYDNCLVEAREQRASSDRQSHDLWIDFGHRLF